MLTVTVCLFALIAFIATLEWALWRKRRRRWAEIDAFMEWYTYPDPDAPAVAAPHQTLRPVGHAARHGTDSRI